MLMILSCELCASLSSAVTETRDKAIIYSRIAIIVLYYCISVIFENIYYFFKNNVLSLFAGLFNVTTLTQIFHLFVFLISAIILQLTAFYPKKLMISEVLADICAYTKTTITTIINSTYINFNNKCLDIESRNLDISYTKGLTFFTIISKIKKRVKSNLDVIGENGQQFKIIEYSLLIFFILLGAVFLISCNDLVSFFLSLELQSYGLYLICTIYRNSESSTFAGLTYFLLGGLSSCFIVLATAIIYANSGLTNLNNFFLITSVSNIVSPASKYLVYINNAIDYNITLIILSVGLLFKISAAPFHFWSPDVYDAIPTIVTTFVAIVTKISLLIFIMQILHYTSNFLYPINFNWKTSLLLSSFLSLIIGTVLGLTQLRIKRLFAYSTISHLGFLLLALTINSLESSKAFIFYIIQYSLSNLNAFVILITIGFSLASFTTSVVNNKKNNKKEIKEYILEKTDNNYNIDRENSPIQLISQIKGYFTINPMLAVLFAITFFSFTGLPPLTGFFAKQMVLSAAIDAGYIFISLVAILTSVISAVYYLNLIKIVFFFKDETHQFIKNNFIYKGKISTDKQVSEETDKSNSVYDVRHNNSSLLGELCYNIKYFNFIAASLPYAFSNRNLTFLSSYLSLTISCISIFLILFIFENQPLLSLVNILALITYNTT